MLKANYENENDLLCQPLYHSINPSIKFLNSAFQNQRPSQSACLYKPNTEKGFRKVYDTKFCKLNQKLFFVYFKKNRKKSQNKNKKNKLNYKKVIIKTL